ncbi:MAG: aminotransferase class III-fold pyridoxal phosphate-dependent enzyme [Deltaproteobacteria bacterium]|nr:aminotransferase class III-fold pyridoxal phosphate-dependent enzyme [Deltaproteobacteria bacterium]
MPLRNALDAAGKYLDHVDELNARYRAGEVRVNVPVALQEPDRALDELAAECLPASHQALEAASQSLFYSLPLAFDPAESVGCYLATIDRDAAGAPYRFIDMGAMIATHAFGENDPTIVAALMNNLAFVSSRYAHSEYQTVLSLKLKAVLNQIAPHGTPRHFVVNTGAEAVENAIKAVLLNRVRTAGEKDGGFIISFEGAFHGRTLGALAVTHRKKARLGFPTFDWPQVPFPSEDTTSPARTLLREEKSLRHIWELLVSGRLPRAEKTRELFFSELERIDTVLTGGCSAEEAQAFVVDERKKLTPDVLKRAKRVAAVLVEPIQGEGGVRTATPRFFQRLRLLTRIYDVPLVFDEVQTGWGTTGAMWAHQRFALPLPPDVVTWAKKAQNGVLFISDELATFFREEKKFNTTWEGDSVGMVRLIAMITKGDPLDAVQRTGALARAGLDKLAHDFPELIQSVRGAGVMLAFDVVRQDWRDALRDRAFRRGLILLPAGDRALRFYPRYDTEPSTIAEAIAILRSSVDDILGKHEAPAASRLNIRVGTHDVPQECIAAVDVDARSFAELAPAIMEVERQRYGSSSLYPPDVLKAGRRPLLQYPVDAFEATMANARSTGVLLRDSVSGDAVAFALGSPLENYDELGVADDPHFGEGTAFYLQATAIDRSVLNQAEVLSWVLDAVRARAAALGFQWLSTLIEAEALTTGPAWLREASVLRSEDNYLRSGVRFVYLQIALPPPAASTST